MIWGHLIWVISWTKAPQLWRLFEKRVMSFHLKKWVAAFAAHSLYYAPWSNVGDGITPYQADTSVLMKASPLILLMGCFLLSELVVCSSFGKKQSFCQPIGMYESLYAIHPISDLPHQINRTIPTYRVFGWLLTMTLVTSNTPSQNA